MNGTKVSVVKLNTVATGTESETETEILCGVLRVRDDWTIKGQTYRIPCHLTCGNEVRLTVKHASAHKDTSIKYKNNGACIHVKEIEAYHTGRVGGFSYL